MQRQPQRDWFGLQSPRRRVLDTVYADYGRNDRRRELLEELNLWRNAIAHQDFDPSVLGGSTVLHLPRVRAWRNACNRLVLSFDNVMRARLQKVTGVFPW